MTCCRNLTELQSPFQDLYVSMANWYQFLEMFSLRCHQRLKSIHSRFQELKWNSQMSFTLNTGVVALGLLKQDCVFFLCSAWEFPSAHFLFLDDGKQRVLLQSATRDWEGHCSQAQKRATGNMFPRWWPVHGGGMTSHELVNWNSKKWSIW